jgi:hypothetical protein
MGSLTRRTRMTAPARPADIGFRRFYADHFRAEHTHPANIAMHVLGTLAGLALMAAGLTVISPWWMLLFPIVHAAPGLLGHRLFERNDAVGDLRVMRTDFPGHWFIAANHLMAAELLVRPFRRSR